MGDGEEFFGLAPEIAIFFLLQKRLFNWCHAPLNA